MIGNIIGKMFERVDPPNTLLLAVAPPRTGDRTMLGVENMLASIAVLEPFSLELAGDSNGVTLMARCAQGSVVKQQLAAHYPQALIQEIPRIKTHCCSKKANKHGRLPCAWKAQSSSHSEHSTTATCSTKAPIH